MNKYDPSKCNKSRKMAALFTDRVENLQGACKNINFAIIQVQDTKRQLLDIAMEPHHVVMSVF